MRIQLNLRLWSRCHCGKVDCSWLMLITGCWRIKARNWHWSGSHWWADERTLSDAFIWFVIRLSHLTRRLQTGQRRWPTFQCCALSTGRSGNCQGDDVTIAGLPRLICIITYKNAAFRCTELNYPHWYTGCASNGGGNDCVEHSLRHRMHNLRRTIIRQTTPTYSLEGR